MMNGSTVSEVRRLCRGAKSLLWGEEAPTAVEYAVMAGLIAAVIAVAVAALGLKVASLFEPVVSGLP